MKHMDKIFLAILLVTAMQLGAMGGNALTAQSIVAVNWPKLYQATAKSLSLAASISRATGLGLAATGLLGLSCVAADGAFGDRTPLIALGSVSASSCAAGISLLLAPTCVKIAGRTAKTLCATSLKIVKDAAGDVIDAADDIISDCCNPVRETAKVLDNIFPCRADE